jgi:hypothetical protein
MHSNARRLWCFYHDQNVCGPCLLRNTCTWLTLEQQPHLQKQNVTGDSQEITQPSTNPAQTGLSCEF